MGHDDSRSGSNAGVVILIVLLVVGLMCGGGVVVLGLGVFSFRAVAREGMAPPPPMMQADEMPMEAKMSAEPTEPAPTEALPAEARPIAPPGTETVPPESSSP